MMKRHVGILFLASVAMLFAVGCGKKGLTPISGTVTLDGQPLERGEIIFQPADESKGAIASTFITDGKYDVSVMPGKKRVLITGGKVIGQHHIGNNPANPKVEDIRPMVPACYNSETALECEIASGQSVQDFELKSSGK